MGRMIILSVAISLCVFGATGAKAFQRLAGWSAEQLQQIPPQQQAPAQLGASIDHFAAGLQQATLQATAPQFAPQPGSTDLSNQVQALGAQLAAANRQIQFYQQQLSMVAGQQQPAQQLGQPQPIQSEPVNQPMSFQSQQQAQLHAQLQRQQQLQAALAAQQQQLAAQQAQFQQAPEAPRQAQLEQQFANQQVLQQQQQQSQAAPVSTLADNQQATSQLANDPRLAGQPQFFGQQQQQILQQQQQLQQLQAQAQAQAQAQTRLEAARQQQLQQQQLQQQQLAPTTSSSVEPSIEPSSVVQQASAAAASQPAQQAPTSHASVHNPAKDDDKFSIGLGVLSPGYTQKFGNTALDFNQDKNGYSFTLSNNGHSNQVPPQSKEKATAAASSQ